MDVVFKHCAGLDVHKKSVVACVLMSSPEGSQRTIKKVATTIASLEGLAGWLSGLGVTHVAMESTGVYWKPVYNMLSAHLEVWVVNAWDMRQVPGRKTDVCDAEWIARLMSYGLLKRSFIPPVEQRDLRDLTRYRKRLVDERTAARNRLEKILEDSNITLASVVSHTQGKSARAMIEALIGGERDPAVMADLAKGRLRPALVEAAWATSHTQTYFGSQFHRLRARRGDKRAAVAVAHSILIVVYHLLANPETVYTELGADYFVKRNVEKEQRRAVRKLQSLGYQVTLTPAQAATSASS